MLMATLSLALAVAVGASSASSASSGNAANYTADWPSIDSRPLPSWYDEAKIGLFIHCEYDIQRAARRSLPLH